MEWKSSITLSLSKISKLIVKFIRSYLCFLEQGQEPCVLWVSVPSSEKEGAGHHHTCASSLIQSLTRVGMAWGRERKCGPQRTGGPLGSLLFMGAGPTPQGQWQRETTWTESVGGGPRDQRALPFLFQGHIQLLNTSVLMKQPGNQKSQKPNNRSDQAGKIRHFLISSLKLSLKHLCVSLSSVSKESTGHFPMLFPPSFLCHSSTPTPTYIGEE